MNKPNNNSNPSKEKITANEIAEYFDQKADFALEMACVNALSTISSRLNFAETYEDPVEKKIRQFDVRACLNSSNKIDQVRLAVECKAIGDEFPLISSRIPRRHNESYHNVVNCDKNWNQEIRCVGSGRCGYQENELVAKSLTQLARGRDQPFKDNDTVAYAKWSQAVNSCFDILSPSWGFKDASPKYYVVIPVLVVPDNTLWSINYDEKGQKIGSPRKEKQVSFFIGRKNYVPNWSRPFNYNISHLEIFTLSGFKNWLPKQKEEWPESLTRYFHNLG